MVHVELHFPNAPGMMNEVGEIISEMEENMNSPMRTLQGFVDQIFVKWLARGIFRR
jgi:hypothetical protein